VTAYDRITRRRAPSAPPSAERVAPDPSAPEALSLERERVGALAELRRAEARAYAAIADGTRAPGAMPALLSWPPAADQLHAMLASRPEWARTAAVARHREADALDDRCAELARQEAALRRRKSSPSPRPDTPRRSA
jgi:hypothetical protein